MAGPWRRSEGRRDRAACSCWRAVDAGARHPATRPGPRAGNRLKLPGPATAWRCWRDPRCARVSWSRRSRSPGRGRAGRGRRAAPPTSRRASTRSPSWWRSTMATRSPYGTASGRCSGSAATATCGPCIARRRPPRPRDVRGRKLWVIGTRGRSRAAVDAIDRSSAPPWTTVPLDGDDVRATAIIAVSPDVVVALAASQDATALVTFDATQARRRATGSRRVHRGGRRRLRWCLGGGAQRRLRPPRDGDVDAVLGRRATARRVLGDPRGAVRARRPDRAGVRGGRVSRHRARASDRGRRHAEQGDRRGSRRGALYGCGTFDRDRDELVVLSRSARDHLVHVAADGGATDEPARCRAGRGRLRGLGRRGVCGCGRRQRDELFSQVDGTAGDPDPVSRRRS